MIRSMFRSTFRFAVSVSLMLRRFSVIDGE